MKLFFYPIAMCFLIVGILFGATLRIIHDDKTNSVLVVKYVPAISPDKLLTYSLRDLTNIEI